MKRLLFAAALAVMFTPIMASAQSMFDGTWKVDMNKVAFPKKPDIYLLLDGSYECKTCTPPYKVKADGTDQPISGNPYFDSVAIKVVSDHEIEETDKKAGKEVTHSTSTVSADGKAVMFEFTDSSNTNGGPPVTGKGEAVRVAPGPAGSHAISGSWRTSQLQNLSDNATTFTYKVDGNSITMTNPTGQTYTAKLDGSDSPMKGDPGTTSVSVQIVDKNTLVEADKRDGKVIGILKITVGADGKNGKASYYDELQNRTTEFEVMKQ